MWLSLRVFERLARFARSPTYVGMNGFRVIHSVGEHRIELFEVVRSFCIQLAGVSVVVGEKKNEKK